MANKRPTKTIKPFALTLSGRLQAVPIFPLEFVEPRKSNRERRRVETWARKTRFPRASVRDVFSAAR